MEAVVMSPTSMVGSDPDQGNVTRAPLAEVDRSGDPHELLTAAQASRLLGHKTPTALNAAIRTGRFIEPDRTETLASGRGRRLYSRRRLWAFADNRPASWPTRANRVGTVTERLAYLFAVVHAPGARPYTAGHVSRWIRADGVGEPISAVYISKLLNGDREPTTRFLPGLARFFGVPPEFFLVQDPPPINGPWLDVQIRLRGDGLQTMLADASSLAPPATAALQDVITSLLRAEGREVFDPEVWDEEQALPALIASAGQLSPASRSSIAAIIARLADVEARPGGRRSSAPDRSAV